MAVGLGFIDHVENLHLEERLGVVRRLVRRARVIVQTIPPDFSILTVALSVVPQPLSGPPQDSNGVVQPGTDALVLVERQARLVDKDPGWVDVDLHYEHLLDGPNQQLNIGGQALTNQAVPGLLYGRGRCSITEKTTNFFWPPGVARTPANRVQILVAHTYPPNDPGVVSVSPLPGLPFTAVQSGEVNVPFPQENFQVSGVSNTLYPIGLARQFVARVNAVAFLGYDAFYWLCTEVKWEVLDTKQFQLLPGAGPLYRFDFEFQYNVDTWNPTVVFNDQRTGRPPYNVEQATVADGTGVLRLAPNPYALALGGAAYLNINPAIQAALGVGLAGIYPNQPAGVWTVPYLEAVDFNQLFLNLFGDSLPGAQ